MNKIRSLITNLKIECQKCKDPMRLLIPTRIKCVENTFSVNVHILMDVEQC